MPDPNIRDLLLARVDEITARMSELMAEVREVTNSWPRSGPGRVGTPITMCSVMVDEIRLRAYARPLDEAGQ